MSSLKSLSDLPAPRPLRVVLDTNVIMALWHFDDPKLQDLKRWVESAEVVLLSDDKCIEELKCVLAYRQFEIQPERQLALLEAYAKKVVMDSATQENIDEIASALPKCRDKDDQKFVELAYCAQANVLLSRDKLVLKLARRREFQDRIFILTPEAMQKILTA